MPIRLEIDWSRRTLQLAEVGAPGFVVRQTLHIPPYTIEGESYMAITLPIDRSATVRIRITDKGGNPANVDGLPAWNVADPALLDLVPAADGLSVRLTPKGALGTTRLSVSADADLGEGTRPIELADDVTLTAGDAANIGFDVTIEPLAA